VIADRSAERLGRSDTLVILFRQLWSRELRNLAEGKPLKQWTRPSSLIPRQPPRPRSRAGEPTATVAEKARV